MVTNIKLSGMASAISKAIVEIVERTDGPVTLAQIEREIPGFAGEGGQAWDYTLAERVVWDGLTEAGTMALSDVISGGKVAIQIVNELYYALEGCLVCCDDCVPIVLLPKKAANLQMPNRLVRVSQSGRDLLAERARAKGVTGYRFLTPSEMRFTADEFATE